MMKWFSDPQPTRGAAEMLHQPKPLAFEPAAIYQTPEGLYVMGFLRVQNWSMDFVREAAVKIEKLTGNKMVSYCEPLLGIWKDFPRKDEI